MAVTIDLSGYVAVVTGGTRGVGAGISRALLEAGADVVACARRPPEQPVAAAGRTARFLPVDLRDPESVSALFAQVKGEYGRLDTLVNNAGGTPYRLLGGGGGGGGGRGGGGGGGRGGHVDADADARHAARTIELNLITPLTASLAAYGLMREQERGGSIVMIGSVSGTRPSPGTAAYGAAKAGLENLARSLAVEWAPKVRVNTLVLGMVHTELSHLHYGDEDGIAAVGRTVPLGRLADPSEVGDACVFLTSDRAAYISGAALPLHGGGERPAFLDAAAAN
ncbi:SDR family oxidoreductase [Streptomyces apocyni]|uniref:SDR family oxidoreductase n=1 Tax=Streptomyces apocyni TaxID=2654677 RepID=UPI0012EA832F|nr:SDR family oxidoreductase [Streptomyces apocyni]